MYLLNLNDAILTKTKQREKNCMTLGLDFDNKFSNNHIATVIRNINLSTRQATEADWFLDAL